MSQVDDPPEGRGQERLLAAVPLPPVARSRAASRSSSTRTTPSIPIADFVATETRFAVLQRTHPGAGRRARRRWPRPTPTSAGATTSSSPASNAPCPHVHRPDPDDRARGRERRGLPLRRRGGRGMTVDLRTRYLGLELRSPIVASAAPHNGEPAMARRLERAGVGAIVLPSLFEEEILAEEIELDALARAGHGALRRGARLLPGRRVVRRRRRPLPRRARAGQGAVARPGHRQPQREHAPAAGSATRGGSRTPGADALELNLYHVAADPRRTAADMEAADLELIAAVRAAVTIPLAVKLSPYYSAFANFAAAAVARRRRRARAVQPLLPAGPRPRHRSRSCRGSS